MEAGSLSPPCRSGSGPPPGGFASLSEVAAALPSVPLGGLEAAAMETNPNPDSAHGGIVTPPANPGSPEYSRDLAPASGQDKLESTRLPSSLAAGPSRKEAPEETTSGHQSSGSANAEVVASTPQTTQPASPPADPSFRCSGPGLGPGRHASCSPKVLSKEHTGLVC